MPYQQKAVVGIHETRSYIECTRKKNNEYFEQLSQDIANYFTPSGSAKSIQVIIRELTEYNTQFNTQIQARRNQLNSLKPPFFNVSNIDQQQDPDVSANKHKLLSSLDHWRQSLLDLANEDTALLNEILDKAGQVERKENIKNRKIELINELNASLTRVQDKFPVMLDDLDLSLNARIGALVHRLSSDVENYIQTLPIGDPLDEIALTAYAAFKKDIDIHLNKDADALYLKKPDSIFYSVHYALIALLRAFFRVFDIIITFVTQAEHTMADTPNRNAFFKYPERQLDKVVLELSGEFTAAMDELDNLSTIEPELSKTA